MATPFQQLVEKALNDKHFRQQFINDPVAAYNTLGLHSDPQVENALRNLDTKGIVALAIAMQGPAQIT